MDHKLIILVECSMSGYGCHLHGVYMGAPSYADDIIITCPSIVELNKMLKICDISLHNSIIKKTVCIKLWDEISEREKAILMLLISNGQKGGAILVIIFILPLCDHCMYAYVSKIIIVVVLYSLCR